MKKYNTLIASLALMGLSNGVNAQTLTDINGNIYNTIAIGKQVWMKENLKVTKYNDGTAIPLVTDAKAWNNTTTPAYCWYDNDSATYKNVYGALYNWYTVNTAKLCPTGWHVSTNEEWTTLVTFLGGYVAGGKLKETGTTNWASPNVGADNSSGFSALPGGYRGWDGLFYFQGGIIGVWWTSTDGDGSSAWNRRLNYNSNMVWGDGYDYDKIVGASVRCVSDVDATGIKKYIDNSRFTLFPNPSDGNFEITCQMPACADRSNVIIYNMLGEKVYQQILNAKQKTLNTKLSKGVYVLQLTTEEGIWNERIIVN